MNIALLDAGGAGLIVVGIAILVFGLLLILLLETVLLTIIKFNSFTKSLKDVFIVNLVSLMAGFLLLFGGPMNNYSSDDIYTLLVLFGVTIIIETYLLYLLNKTKPIRKTVLASVLMNVASYILLYFLLKL